MSNIKPRPQSVVCLIFNPENVLRYISFNSRSIIQKLPFFLLSSCVPRLHNRYDSNSLKRHSVDNNLSRLSPATEAVMGTPVTLLVVNLSVCDLLSGVLLGCGSLYFDITVLAARTNEQLLTGIKRTVAILTTTGILIYIVGSCTVIAMAFDRLVAISWPLWYKTRVTKMKVTVFIVSVWIYSLLFTSPSRMGVPRKIFFLLYCHLHLSLPLVILACSRLLANVPSSSSTQQSSLGFGQWRRTREPSS